MPTPSTATLPKPRSEDEFEEIAVDCLRIRWRDPNAHRNGRRGQRQHGVDIIGNPPWLSGKLAGGQCKNTDSLTLREVTREIEKAKSFDGGLGEFYVVTSSDRDAKLQADVRKYLASNPAPFGVVLLFWDDVVQEVAKDADAVAKHWKGFPVDLGADSERYDEETQIAELRHRHQDALVGILVERLSRQEFEQLLTRTGHDDILNEVEHDSAYSTLTRYAVTRAIVGDWLRDLLDALPATVLEDASLQGVREVLGKPSLGGDHRRRRLAMLLQHMFRLEGQQVDTPGFLQIARDHESPVKTGNDAPLSGDDELSDYTGAISLESIRDHLHDVLETTVRIISELDADTIVAQEAPDAYVALMRGMNGRARILRHALKHGVAEHAARDYRKLMSERDEAVARLVSHLIDRV
jgi:hypothetical protein